MTTSSVRRFCAWPPAVALLATGLASPPLAVVIRLRIDAGTGQRLGDDGGTVRAELDVGRVGAARIGIADQLDHRLGIGRQDLRQRVQRRLIVGAQRRGRRVEVELVEGEGARRRGVRGEERLQVVVQCRRLQVDHLAAWERDMLDCDGRRSRRRGTGRGRSDDGIVVSVAATQRQQGGKDAEPQQDPGKPVGLLLLDVHLAWRRTSGVVRIGHGLLSCCG